ncbi:hypothetical protein BDU57DRAFT_512194 [Ampelomyces quisqualis]|uniref:Secreted protein n=1 Tax=Ampelomyces quisqualis TaxID=50730 RepID=A0A6A5QUT5_AMPQU|nr:hypothetical protein BDU57DRAFT_512194 [Ampelomyces quisqualis]
MESARCVLTKALSLILLVSPAKPGPRAGSLALLPLILPPRCRMYIRHGALPPDPAAFILTPFKPLHSFRSSKSPSALPGCSPLVPFTSLFNRAYPRAHRRAANQRPHHHHTHCVSSSCRLYRPYPYTPLLSRR